MKNIFFHESNLPQTAFLLGESHVINLILHGYYIIKEAVFVSVSSLFQAI